ncbi:unannotated protein [freshwater metagenome]|uniref:Unannotated protein n=1 Tax=freshwater metagenome TaxID=449393 RepID=A0A6J7FYL0_9ZZZZ
MHRHNVLRLQNVVAIQQFTGGRVARHVHFGIALVHDVGAETGEAVNDTVNGILVSGNQTRGQDDCVARPDLDLMFEVCHARQNGHRLTL